MYEAPVHLFHTESIKLTTNYLVEGELYWLNALSSKNIFSNTIGPAGIFLGRTQTDFNSKIKSFVAYAIDYTKTKNDMKSRWVTAIALRP